MREIVVIRREIRPQNGRRVLYERKYHGVLRPDGSIRLLAFCGKRVPLPAVSAGASEYVEENRKPAA